MADEAHEEVHIDADPSVCFAVATDFEAYPTWANDVKHARVVARDDAGRPTRVDYRAAALGRSIRYVLDYDLSGAPATFSWHLVEGDMLRALDGRYTFEAGAAAAGTDGGTDVTYDLTVDLAIPLPTLVKRAAAGRIVGAALADLKHAVEWRVGAHSPEAAEGAASTAADARVTVDPDPDVPGADADDDAGTPYEQVGSEPRALPAPSYLELVIGELVGAVPEVRDHLLAAADELLDAARALLEAAERVLRQPDGGTGEGSR